MKEWKNNFQDKMILRQSQDEDGSINNGTLHHLNDTLSELKDEIENRGKSQKKEDLKTGQSKLPKLQVQMIKNMLLVDGVDLVEDLAETMINFLEQKTSAYAYGHLQDKLRDRKVVNRNLVFGNVQSIHQG
eukprot:5539958-Ditylum_brightwellii.AAC.1